MKDSKIRQAGVLAIATAVGVLAGCGDSDLEPHHLDKLAEARAASDGGTGPDAGAAGAADPGNDLSIDGNGEEGDGSAGGEADAGGAGGESTGGTADGTDNETAPDGTDTGTGTGTDTGTDTGAGGAQPEVDLAEYDLVFADEFDGVALDFNNWKTAYEWGPDVQISGEQQYYVDTATNPDFGYDPFTVADGFLTISAIETPDSLRASANDQPWLSGVLTTAGKHDFTYGFMEARVDLPEGVGITPALWLLHRDYEGLKPRVYIMEYDGGRPDDIFHRYDREEADGTLISSGYQGSRTPGASDGFHTIGLSWTPTDLYFYVDGEPRFRMVGEALPKQAMYPILNLAIGGSFAGAPDASTPRPAEVVFDYVRIWQKQGTAAQE